jgi:hypothetical protein
LIYERRTAGPPSPEIVPDNDENKALLRDLAHYALYANAVYGWKMELAMHFRLHMGGNVQALLRLTGVKRDDIILTKWESKTHQPAYFVVRDRSHKTLLHSRDAVRARPVDGSLLHATRF